MKKWRAKDFCKSGLSTRCTCHLKKGSSPPNWDKNTPFRHKLNFERQKWTEIVWQQWGDKKWKVEMLCPPWKSETLCPPWKAETIGLGRTYNGNALPDVESENAMPAVSWYDDPTDTELNRIDALLTRLVQEDDVRKVIRTIIQNNKIDPR